MFTGHPCTASVEAAFGVSTNALYAQLEVKKIVKFSFRGRIPQELAGLLGQHVLHVIESSFFHDTMPRQRLMGWVQSFQLTNGTMAPEISIFLPTSRRGLHREEYARTRIVGVTELLMCIKPTVRFRYLNDKDLAALAV